MQIEYGSEADRRIRKEISKVYIVFIVCFFFIDVYNEYLENIVIKYMFLWYSDLEHFLIYFHLFFRDPITEQFYPRQNVISRWKSCISSFWFNMNVDYINSISDNWTWTYSRFKIDMFIFIFFNALFDLTDSLTLRIFIQVMMVISQLLLAVLIENYLRS